LTRRKVAALNEGTDHFGAEGGVVNEDGSDEATLKNVANQAKEQCPISVLLRPGLESITLNVTLK